ncbi:MAG TPA: RNA methyltransferase [Saprospiraceae bacterium]|nr:RNA methyltransferase [Saprospiraceae bacterium]HRK80629.1 RNA methyltransferase [Saprospiraceae bacterium]
MTKVITSVQNPLIKNIVLLTEKARERKAQGLFVAEGLRETAMALAAGYEAEAILYDPARTGFDDLLPFQKMAPDALTEVSRAVFEKTAYRSGVPNVVALLRTRPLVLDNIALPRCPLILVLESVEKPGNLGAILRTADAAGVDAVILCDPLTDWHNPNVIRASLGAVFTVPVATTDSEQVLAWLRRQGVKLAVTHLEASHPHYLTDFTQPTAIVMGAEATGISAFWIEAADERVIIPMQGRVDSLNVSASTAVLLFEARRQRGESASQFI